MDAILPPFPEPPTGYTLKIYGNSGARKAYYLWGILPLRLVTGTYALWIPTKGPPPLHNPVLTDVRKWLREHGAVARELAKKDLNFGLQRLLAHAIVVGAPIPEAYRGDAFLARSFLEAAAWILDRRKRHTERGAAEREPDEPEDEPNS